MKEGKAEWVEEGEWRRPWRSLKSRVYEFGTGAARCQEKIKEIRLGGKGA